MCGGEDGAGDVPWACHARAADEAQQVNSLSHVFGNTAAPEALKSAKVLEEAASSREAFTAFTAGVGCCCDTE